ncbi:MAG: hypothetical protein V2J11_00205 [Desulfofustis sp.]|jgi:hypothetical protein|nr:hypothetical protein [Desulfofustis sp.]
MIENTGGKKEAGPEHDAWRDRWREGVKEEKKCPVATSCKDPALELDNNHSSGDCRIAVNENPPLTRCPVTSSEKMARIGSPLHQ